MKRVQDSVNPRGLEDSGKGETPHALVFSLSFLPGPLGTEFSQTSLSLKAMYSAPRVYRALRLAVREVDLLPVLTISRIFSVLTPGGPGTPFLHLFSGSLLRGGRFHGNNDTVTLVLGCPSPNPDAPRGGPKREFISCLCLQALRFFTPPCHFFPCLQSRQALPREILDNISLNWALEKCL